MLIDVAMLNAAIAIQTAFVAACLLFMSRHQWQQMGVRFWLIASALVAIGHGINACSRLGLPGWLVGYVAIHLIFLGGVFHLWGARIFLDQGFPLKYLLIGTASYFALSILLRVLHLNLIASSLMWLAIATVNLLVVWMLFKVRSQIPWRTVLVLGLGFLLVGLVYVECVLEDHFFPMEIKAHAPPPWVYVACAMILIMAQIAKGMGFLMLLNDRLEQSLRLSAELDALTGVYNRRGFFHHANELLAQTARSQKTVLMLDVDHFKWVNDEYGHQIGDAVLKEVALRIRRVLREGDLIARYGGEEFIVLTFETEKNFALIVAERMRAEVEAHPVQIKHHQIALTISIGISCWNDAQQDLDTQIAKADGALYIAKNTGRNRVELAA